MEKPFPVPTGTPKRSKRLIKGNDTASRSAEPSLPVISRVQSLATNGTVPMASRTTRSKTSITSSATTVPQPVSVQSNIEIPVQVRQ